MRILKLVAITVGVLIGLFVVGGLMLPHEWHVERTTVISAPPQAIYRRVANLKRWPEWTQGKGVELNPEVKNVYSGPDEGVGAAWEWQAPKRPAQSMIVTRAEPERGVWFDEKIEGELKSHSAITFSPEESGTRVIWMNEGTLPLIRGGYQRRAVEQLLSEQFQGALERLKKVTEEDVQAAPGAGAAQGTDAGQGVDGGNGAEGGKGADGVTAVPPASDAR